MPWWKSKSWSPLQHIKWHIESRFQCKVPWKLLASSLVDAWSSCWTRVSLIGNETIIEKYEVFYWMLNDPRKPITLTIIFCSWVKERRPFITSIRLILWFSEEMWSTCSLSWRHYPQWSFALYVKFISNNSFECVEIMSISFVYFCREAIWWVVAAFGYGGSQGSFKVGVL